MQKRPLEKKPSRAELLEHLTYDPETGIFRWREDVHRNGHKYFGLRAGKIDNHGYMKIKLFQRSWRASHLACVMMTDEWPPETVDHINRNRSDDRWANLRFATLAQQRGNLRLNANNTTGARGVQRAQSGRYQAVFAHKHLGTFDTIAEAQAAHEAAARAVFGEFYIPPIPTPVGKDGENG